MHLIVDGLDELTTSDRAVVATRLGTLRTKLPRVAVLLCCRPHDLPASAWPFPAVQLAGLHARQVTDHVIRLVAKGELTPAQARAILNFPWGDDAPEWPRTPGALAALTTLARSGVAPRSVAEVDTVAAVAALRLPAQAHDEALVALEAVAEHILAADAPAPDVTVPPDLLEPLQSAGLLRRSAEGMRFVADHQRDYFAARALLRRAEAAPGEPAGRVRERVWDRPCRVLVSLPETPDWVVAVLVEAVAPGDPERAAGLLGVARSRPPDLVRGFVAARRAELAEADTAATAARALVAYGGPEAVEVLHAVAVDPSAPGHARIPALGGVAECAPGAPLRAALHATLLGEDDPVRAFAARTVASTRATGLELVLAELVDPAVDWAVCDAAAIALRALDVHVPAAVLTQYHAACQARLIDLERKLPTLVTNRDVLEVQRERVRLLETLAGWENVEWLLDRRLDFEVGAPVAAFLDQLPARTGGDDRATRLLTGGHDPEAWLAAVRTGDRAEAGAGLHCLLRDAPEQAGRLLTTAEHTSGAELSRNELCALAAVVPCLDAADLDVVERRYAGVPASVGADCLDGLAALVRAVYRADRRRGVRMAWRGAAALVERRLPERLCWPWQRALSLCRGTPADLEELLAAGGDSADLAVSALASYDFHRDGGTGPNHSFGAAARRELLARQPGPGADVDAVLRWALAVATASAVEALPGLLTIAGQLRGHAARPVATNRFGLLHRAPLADVLTGVGWLARESGEAHEFLASLDTSGAHESVHTGRLVALAYLGDGLPLLAEVGDGDPVVVSAAVNAVRHWLPGPCSPAEIGTPRALLDLLRARTAAPDLPAGERRTLAELLAVAERRGAKPAT